MLTTTRDAYPMALGYLDAGLAPLPFPHGSKKPYRFFPVSDYYDHAPSRAEVVGMFDLTREQNVALVCGRASGGVFELDADDPPTFERWLYTLAGLGIHTWVTQRDRAEYGQPGFEHNDGGGFWLRWPASVATKARDTWDVKGQRSYALAPYSRHPGGPVYRTVVGDPRDIFTLPRLDAIPGLDLTPASPMEPQYSQWAWSLLKGEPHALAHYNGDRSDAEYNLVLSLANKGLVFSEIEALFQMWPCAGKYAEKRRDDPREARRYLVQTFQRAQIQAPRLSRGRALALSLAAWASERAWPGRTGATDRAVYVAHLEIARRCGREQYAAGVRDLSELAGVHQVTAWRASARLVDAGLLRSVTQATYTLAARYALASPKCGLNATLPHVPPMGALLEVHHDAFRGRKLGKSGQQVWDALRERGRLSVHELVEITGRCGRTIRRKLARLAELGQVELMGREWALTPDAELDVIAEALGTAGRGELQHERNVAERARRRVLRRTERAN